MDIQAYPGSVYPLSSRLRDYSDAWRVYRDWRLRQGVVSSLGRKIGPAGEALPPPSMKRGRLGDATTDGHVGGIQQVKFSRSRCGRRERHGVRQLWRKQLLNQKYMVSRWQSIAGFNQGWGSMWLSHHTTTANNVTELPVYAFNLSSLPYQSTTDPGGTAIMASLPMYRLRFDSSQASPKYMWTSYAGVGNDGEGVENVKRWRLEDMNTNEPARNPYWQHNWADIRMHFIGAKNRPVKIHCYVVSFRDECGPMRQMTGISTEDPVNYDDSYPETALAQENDNFWNHYLATKVFSPIRTSKCDYPRKLIVHKHESVLLNPDVSINNDTNPVQVVKKWFYRFDQYYKGVKDDPEGDDIVNVSRPEYNNDFKNEVASLFPKRSADKWLLIVGEVFDRIENSSDTNLTQPSFDINVRCKYTLVN